MAKPNFNKPWGYKIDYAKAIAEQEQYRDAIQFHLDHKIHLPEGDERLSWHPIAWVLVERADVLKALGLSDVEVRCAMAYRELDSVEIDFDRLPGDWYSVGERVSTLLEDKIFPFIRTEEQLKQDLKKAKSNITRYKRNQVKYGAPAK